MSEDDGKQHLAEQAMAGPSQSHLGAQGKVFRHGQQGTSSSSAEGAEPQQEIQPWEEEGDPVPASKGQEAPRRSPTKKVHWKKRVLRLLPYSRLPQQIQGARVRQVKEKQQRTSVTGVKEGEGKDALCFQDSSGKQDRNQKQEERDEPIPVLGQVLLGQQQTGESHREILEGDLRSYTEEESSQSSSHEQSTQLRKSPAESPEEGRKGKSHKCSHCGKRFRLPSLLISHQRVHTVEKPYQCNVCGRSFRRSWDLGRHKSLHSEEKPHECDQCGKSFRRRDQLTQHQRIHSGERPFQCNVCGKSFSDSNTCRRHQSLHSGEKLYKCEECGKSFALKHSLAQHQQIHSGKKPFQCNVCGKSFRRSTHLRGHQAVHSREEVSKCEVCGKSFALNSGLAKEIHTSEKPSRCEECRKSFSHKSDPGQHPPVDAGEKLHKSE